MADLSQNVQGALSQLPQSPLSAENQPANNNEGLSGPTQSSSFDRERSRERQGNPAMHPLQAVVPSRGGTLKKRRSLSRRGSLKRSGSRKSNHPGLIGTNGIDGQGESAANYGSEMNSAFYTPVTTTGSPTETLANRFQGE